MEGVGQADPKNTAAGNSPGARYRDPLLAVEGMVPENQVRQREASPSLFSVSYTHLDVYKRQPFT